MNEQRKVTWDLQRQPRQRSASLASELARRAMLVTRLAAWSAAMASAACVAAPELEANEQPEISSKEQAFAVLSGSNSTLIAKIQNSTIRACLTGGGVTSANRSTYETWIRDAVLAWVNAARPVATVTLVNSVTFTCSSPDLTVTVLPTSGRANTVVTNVTLYAPDGYDVLLHEVGHAFGLGDTYQEEFVACLPGQEQSVMCHATIFTRPQPDDINGIQETYCRKFNTTCKRRVPLTAMSAWCAQSTDELLVGDFNNDGRDDLLCHNKATGWKSTSLASTTGTFAGTSWTSNMQWCNQASDQLLLGDFNGDGRDDMLCHQKVTGWKSVALANSAGQFTGTSWTSNMQWCLQSNDQLLIGDFNGDGRDDMLCHNKGTGWKSISSASAAGTFSGTTWTSDMRWCIANGLYVGDFNGDNRDDMICHAKQTGSLTTSLATSSGTFSGTSWSSSWGGWCQFSTGQMLVGDFNGNNRDDILCHDPSTGFKVIALSDFGGSGSFPGVSRIWNMEWCIANDTVPTRLFVGDFHNDNVSDFLCYGLNNGPLSIGRQSL